jgi:putative FmdB family regulatory protein
MIEYDYRCKSEECGLEWSELQSIKDDSSRLCPFCTKETAQRVLYPFNLTVKDIKTVGQLADKNTREMGIYERQAHEADLAEKMKRKPYIGPHADRAVEVGKKTDIVNDGVSDVKIRSMNNEQRKRYIETGKAPL